MAVEFEWHGEDFQRKFYDEVGKELVRSAKIMRKNLAVTLATTGKSSKSPRVSSPPTSKIPWNLTGTLAGSWHATPRAYKVGKKLTAGIFTNVIYAFWLHVKNPEEGGRNFMDENLYWYQKTMAAIGKRLEAQRLVDSAVRSMK
jgi:hypothetical protein